MIDKTYFWLIVSGISIGTFMTRFGFIAFSSRLKISPTIQELFSFIPAIVLPALITPMVFFHNGELDWLLGKERFIVLIFATVFCYITKSMVGTILFGLISLYLLKLI